MPKKTLAPKPLPTVAPVIKIGAIEIKCRYTELVEVSKIKPHPDNPNHHPAEQLTVLEKLIRAQGFRRPLVVSRRSGLLIKGHGLLEVARKKLKLKKVPVEYQDYASAAQEQADMVADNAVAQMSEMPPEELLALVKDVKIEFPTFDVGLFALSPNLLAMLDEKLPDLPLVEKPHKGKGEPESKTDGRPVFKVSLTAAQHGKVLTILNQERREFQLRSIGVALVHILERLKRKKAGTITHIGKVSKS